MITDSELLKLAEDWFKEQPINLGAKIAFAAGYRLAELKNCNLPHVSQRSELLAFKQFISKTPQTELEYYSDEEFTDLYLKANCG